ncbi:unnamed protein product [Rotaria sordida]|uniref:Uncharacterized protein n=1 Tax=Rotaria sordida TaxID=392033 RepID=A0A819RF96_9BILA|nr:unnamed protein product [Rotaria sordida]
MSIIMIIINYLLTQLPSLVTTITISHSLNINFKRQLFNERLSSYNLFYDNSLSSCNTTRSLSEDQQRHFHGISQLLQIFQQKIVPYPNNHFYGRGIVLTVGPSQLKFAEVNLKMIELTATKLPIQIWYSSSQISHEIMIGLLRTVRNLNASICCFLMTECRTLTQTWQLNPTHVYKPSSNNQKYKFFPYKPAAIVSATFSEVLFLDCDAYVTRDPEELFLSDPMYLKFGALFYPDAHKSRQHPAVWTLFNTSCTQHEYEFDSAMILVDKRRVWNGLYMTKLINDYYPAFYEHVTDGDKDTFRLAFRYMQVKYYLVMTPCATGSFNNTHFCGLTLCKTDSLSQHIYVNHIHIFKYEGIKYSPITLGYTRIGLGDPNNNSFFFQHCRLPAAPTSCFHIMKKRNEEMAKTNCYSGNIPLKEIENHAYMLNESLLSKPSKNNRVLMSKTNNFMPNFVENFLRIQQPILNN